MVLICNDEMLGHFSLRTVQAQGAQDKKLIDFTRAACVGGTGTFWPTKFLEVGGEFDPLRQVASIGFPIATGEMT